MEKSFDGIPLYDDVAWEEIGGDLEEEVGLSLKIKKTLLTPK